MHTSRFTACLVLSLLFLPACTLTSSDGSTRSELGRDGGDGSAPLDGGPAPGSDDGPSGCETPDAAPCCGGPPDAGWPDGGEWGDLDAGPCCGGWPDAAWWEGRDAGKADAY